MLPQQISGKQDSHRGGHIIGEALLQLPVSILQNPDKTLVSVVLAVLVVLVVLPLMLALLHVGKAMKSSLIGPFCGAEFWGFSLLKI